MDARYASRKFWFTAVWNLTLILAIVVTAINGASPDWMGTLVTFAGTITTAYIGVQGYADAKGVKK